LEHALSQFELARERERNAEEQLDKVLSLHARQLGMRQKRESELEQTVADLGAALVVAKGKVERAGMAESSAGEGGREQEEEGLKERLADSQDEIEMLRAQLTLERQRCVTLHSELQDLAKEQADEISAAHARQRHYERKISDLTTLVAKVQSSSTRLYEEGDGNDASPGDSSGCDQFGGYGLQYSGDEKK
jgi:chromosome segregation ATPase